jgi:hypothetical protein
MLPIQSPYCVQLGSYAGQRAGSRLWKRHLCLSISFSELVSRPLSYHARSTKAPSGTHTLISNAQF